MGQPILSQNRVVSECALLMRAMAKGKSVNIRLPDWGDWHVPRVRVWRGNANRLVNCRMVPGVEFSFLL